MYCISCKKNKVSPTVFPGDTKSEEDILWGKEEREYDLEIKRVVNINSQMIDDGIIETITAGYGSKYDTNEFIIAICDDCIKENLEDGTLLYYGNYMANSDDKYAVESRENSRKIYKRRKNLDGLI